MAAVQRGRPAGIGPASKVLNAPATIPATTDIMLTAALAYAETGWPVFFLGRSKRPVANCPACRDADDDHDREACDCLICHGLYAATTDPDRIRAMRAAVPRGMLAVRTGAPSGIVVVDIDPANGGRVHPELMPPTAYVRTGSGGLHLYYQHPGHPVPCSAGRLSPGIDVRGDGGYVILPPSVHPRTGRPYVWVRRGPVEEMPPALVAACMPAPERAPEPRATSTTPAGGISYPDRLLAAHLDAVRRAPEGRRRVTLYGSARGVARMVAAGAIGAADAYAALADVGRSAGQTERETRAAIVGGFKAEGVAS